MKHVTTSNLHECSLQEVFDFIVNHLRTQVEKAIGDEICVYLGKDGKTCAAGCLIEPEKYRSHFEGQKWIDISYELTGEWPDATVNKLIRDMQIVHDQSTTIDWEAEFETVAKSYDLKYTKP